MNTEKEKENRKAMHCKTQQTHEVNLNEHYLCNPPLPCL